MKGYIFILLLCLFAMSCVNNNQNQKAEQEISESEVKPSESSEKNEFKFWEFDMRKEYPAKDLYIQDIADVEYLPIETNDSMLWLGREINYVDDDIIMAANDKSGVLFHDRKSGKALYSFHRKGNGPEEYRVLSSVAYDKEKNEVFVLDMMSSKYYVYDDKGKFIRKFIAEGKQRPYRFFLCGNDELVEYNAENTYTRRSRKDGKTLEVFTFGDNPNFGLAFNKDNLRYNMATNMFIKDNDGYILSAFASDTTWLFTSEMKKEPIGVRTPSVLSMEVPKFLLPIKNTPNYYFMYAVERSEEYPVDMYMIDKNSNQIYWLKNMLKNKDCINHEVDLDLSGRICDANIPTDLSIQALGALGLIKANEDGRLSGKLKEIADNLDEGDNPVLMIMKFKKE